MAGSFFPDPEEDFDLRPPPRNQINYQHGARVTDEDLESDEAAWALYERWCKAQNKHLHNIFEENAESVLEHHKVSKDVPKEEYLLGPSCDLFNVKGICFT
ncbi:hypothetical protein BS78_10G252800 [Paspalum vaginatum]|nr:hypothetical protein BS78_10G252800 [Paspalum vaginatum]